MCFPLGWVEVRLIDALNFGRDYLHTLDQLLELTSKSLNVQELSQRMLMGTSHSTTATQPS